MLFKTTCILSITLIVVIIITVFILLLIYIVHSWLHIFLHIVPLVRIYWPFSVLFIAQDFEPLWESPSAGYELFLLTPWSTLTRRPFLWHVSTLILLYRYFQYYLWDISDIQKAIKNNEMNTWVPTAQLKKYYFCPSRHTITTENTGKAKPQTGRRYVQHIQSSEAAIYPLPD